jgi:hypothetical protein
MTCAQPYLLDDNGEGRRAVGHDNHAHANILADAIRDFDFLGGFWYASSVAVPALPLESSETILYKEPPGHAPDQRTKV